MSEAEELAKKIVAENDTCILATASPDGKPEAAIVQYAEDEQFNLYVETSTEYRKYKNMKSNPQASVVITQGLHTVQMDGILEGLKGAEAEDANQKRIKKFGKASSYSADPTRCWVRFTPKWIRVLVKPKYPSKFVVIKHEH